jgi:hypothetical protein
VVDEIHHHVIAGDGLDRLPIDVVALHPVQEIDEHAGEVVAELVVGEHVELRYDLVDVPLDAGTDLGLLLVVLGGVGAYGLFDHRVVQQLLSDGASAHELVAVESDTELMHGAQDGAVEPVTDGPARPADGPQREAGGEERRHSQEQPIEQGEDQTSSGRTPVFSYW